MRNPDGNRETEGALLRGAGGQFLGRTLFGCFGLARRDLSRSSFAQDDVEAVGCRHVRLPERHPEGALSRPEDIRLLKSHSERPTNSERRESKNLFESSGSRPWGSSPPFPRDSSTPLRSARNDDFQSCFADLLGNRSARSEARKCFQNDSWACGRAPC